MKIKFSSKHECAPCKPICNIIIFSLAQQSLRNWTFSLSKPDNEALSALEHGSKQFPLRLPPVQLTRWEPFIAISSWRLSLPVLLSAPYVRAAKLLWGAILQEEFLQFCVVSFYCHGHPKAEEAILKLRKAVLS